MNRSDPRIMLPAATVLIGMSTPVSVLPQGYRGSLIARWRNPGFSPDRSRSDSSDGICHENHRPDQHIAQGVNAAYEDGCDGGRGRRGPGDGAGILSVVLAVLTCFSPLALAQGGPPFRSDDPDTPGNKRWEINTMFIGDRNPSGGSYVVPNIDVNYGIGSRIQLKYEVPLSLQESRGAAGQVAGGLGNSLLGVKWRFYAHHPKSESGEMNKKESTFGVSIYPQLLLSNPTSSVRRDIVEPGPQLLIPLEANAKIGPLRISGEFGYWFTNKNVPNTWIRGVIVGHEFRSKTELYLELYDEAATRETVNEPKIRESTIGIGFRTPMTGSGSLWLMGMAGRSLVTATATNGQPSWIASVGLQILTGKKRRNSSD